MDPLSVAKRIPARAAFAYRLFITTACVIRTLDMIRLIFPPWILLPAAALTSTVGPGDLAAMRIPRWTALALSFLAAAPLCPAATAAGATPVQTVQDFCDALVAAMKQGPALGFAGRRQMLDPQIRRAMDLPLMTRLVVGPPWKGLAAPDQQRLVDAFSDYSIAVYASRFKEYGGERFVVEPAATRRPNGDVIVSTKLLPKDGDTVQLDYLMRESARGWQVIDVFLSGTISEIAARRSEYSSVFRTGGAAALVELLLMKTAELGG
jgi:phospholipid transport system substrate-binding protein